MITFSLKIENQDYPHTATRNVTMNVVDGATISEVLESFGDFLHACGYRLSGVLVVEEPEEENNKELVPEHLVDDKIKKPKNRKK